MDNTAPEESKRYQYRQLAAVVTWLLVAYIHLQPFSENAWPLLRWVGLASLGLFGAAIYRVTQPSVHPLLDSRQARCVALLVAALSVLFMVLAGPGGEVFILVIIIASIMPDFFSIKRSALMLLGLHCLLLLAYLYRWEVPAGFIVQSMLWLGFDAFALITSQIATEERRSRQAMQFSRGQVKATQNMLASASRQDERLRISRDIHDVIGHHLTGLSIQLEVASHSEADKAREHIAQGQLITKLLLSDVRQVVSDLREMEGLDLGQSLRSLVSNVGALQVELDFPERLQVSDTRVAEAIFRAVQEIITNCVRHSSAALLRVQLREADGTIHIKAEDDGKIAILPREGNGITGMRERLEALGGSLKLTIDPGLKYEIHVPVAFQ